MCQADTHAQMVQLSVRCRETQMAVSVLTGVEFVTNNVRSSVRIPDIDYMYFGIWLGEPDIASEAHEFDAFFGGMTTTDTIALPSSGTVTYRGGAIGKYVTRNQVNQTATIGTFTADALLTARFDSGGQVDGVIDNFRDGSRSLTGWGVTLGGVTTSATWSTVGTTATFGIVTGTGNWDGGLFDSSRNDGYPGGVAGTFNAFSALPAGATQPSVGVSGAFGATNSNPDS